MLTRRELPSRDTMHRAIDAVGGLWVLPAGADARVVSEEVIARGIRAIEVSAGGSVEALRGLPIEFLIVGDADEVDAIGTLQGLRGLHVGSWSGVLDFGALPLLEWFGSTEPGRGQLDPLLRSERNRLHHLAVGRYPFADLSPLARLTGVTHLALGDTRVLGTLAGVEALPGLRHLSVYACPKLTSLPGTDVAAGLEHVEIESCNRVVDLSPLASLRGLRSVKIQARTPPPLTPLSDSASLEYVWVVSTKRLPRDVVERLLGVPTLRLLVTGRSCWLRDDGRWHAVPDIYAMTDRASELHALYVSEWQTVTAW